VIMPGLMNTPMAIEGISAARGIARDELVRQRDAQAPLGRMGTAWDVAHAALFLASDEAGFITGVALAVDGGQSARIGWRGDGRVAPARPPGSSPGSSRGGSGCSAASVDPALGDDVAVGVADLVAGVGRERLAAHLAGRVEGRRDGEAACFALGRRGGRGRGEREREQRDTEASRAHGWTSQEPPDLRHRVRSCRGPRLQARPVTPVRAAPSWPTMPG